MKRFVSISLLAIVASVCAVGLAPPAGAHGELEDAKPAPNSHLKAPPSDVTMTFSEEPSSDSVIRVSDGCKNDVVERLVVDGNDFVASLATGQPGKWQASFRVISAEDGHLTKGNYSFDVAGKKDCSKDGDGNGNGKGDETTDDGTPKATGPNGSDDGSDFPVVPVVIAAVVLVIVGIVVRRMSAG
jgi:copper resistance protein C